MRRFRIESIGVSMPGPSLLTRGSLHHAVKAGKRCLEASAYNPADVGVLVNAGVHRDEHVCEPAIAAYVQHGLGINIEFQGRRTLAFDLLNGGCGMLNGVHVVGSLLLAGDIHAGMVVASEHNSDARPDPEWKHPASGAAVVVDLSPRARPGFGAFAFQTREELAGLYTSVVSLAMPQGKLLLRRQRELHDAWLAGARAAMDEALEKDGLKRDDVDLVIPSQIAAPFVARLPEVLGVPKERVLDLTGTLADTLSTSVFLGFHEATRLKRLAPGKRALLLAFGSGLTIGAATYHA